jgi:hypothetical protein
MFTTHSRSGCLARGEGGRRSPCLVMRAPGGVLTTQIECRHESVVVENLRVLAHKTEGVACFSGSLRRTQEFSSSEAARDDHQSACRR